MFNHGKNHDVHLYVDGNEYNSPEHKDMEKFFIPQQNGKWKANVVGFYCFNNAIYIFLPKNSDIRSITQKEINILFEFLNYELSQEDSILEDTQILSNNLYGIVYWLIQDFHQHGIYTSREKINKKQKNGKINWKASIKKIQPIIINNKSYYHEFIKSSYINESDIISLIHEWVMYDISNKYGRYMFNFQFSKGPSLIINNSNKQKQLKILESKIKITNNKRNQYLFKNLYYYLKKINYKGNESIFLITYNFNILFEKVIKSYLNHKDLSDRLSTAKWEFYYKNSIKRAENRQIVDTFVVNDNVVDIYDAKYYSLNKLENRKDNSSLLLDWYSVGKQFLYYISFKEKENNNTKFTLGTNNFIFPIFPLPDKNHELVKKIDSNIIRIGDISFEILEKNEKIEILLSDTFSILKNVLENNK